MTDLNELLERVRSATGPDRYLDALIEVEARRQEAYRAGLNDQQRAYWNATVDGLVYDSATRYDAPRLTASTDAALAVVERVLPGCAVAHIGEDYSTPPKHTIGWTVELEQMDDATFQGQAPTLPIAILVALLQTLISMESQS